MADLSVIKQYLVSLGFTVDQPSLNKFQDALRTVSQQVERATMGTFGIASLFAKTGAAVTGALASIAAGTVGLMDHVAQSDLQFQLFARRMFISTDAARSLKIATDALGYSLEEIVWGPREIQERFRTLTGDQAILQRGLGGDFETQMRRIRDIRFELTRLEVASKYFLMNLVKSLSVMLGGDENSLLNKLREFNQWFQQNIPAIANQVASYLAPVMRDVAAIFRDLWDITKLVTGEVLRFVGALYGDGKLKSGTVNIENFGRALDHVSTTMRDIVHAIDQIVQYIVAHPFLEKILGGMAAGAATGGAIGSVFPGLGTGAGAALGAAIGGAAAAGGSSPSDVRGAVQSMIRNMAVQMGLDPAIALAIADKESGFNQGARGKAGEIGIMQLMPGTAMGLGVDPNDPQQNVRGGITYLLQLYAKYHDWQKAIAAYNGSGPAARAYADDVMHRIPRWQQGMEYGGHGGGAGVTIGKIDINVTEPHATKEQVYAAVVKGIDDKLNKQAKQNIVQLSGAYA